jgi:hypothetical protein
MSDKSYQINKAIKRQYDKAEVVSLDTQGTASWTSYGSMACIAMVFLAFFMSFTNRLSGAPQIIAYVVMGIGAVGIIVFAIIGKTKDAAAFVEYVYHYEGKDLHFQYVGKNHVCFYCDDVAFEFYKKQVVKLDEPFAKNLAFDNLLDVFFYDAKFKKDTWTYSGEIEKVADGKKTVIPVKISVGKNKTLKSYNIGKTLVNFNAVRLGDQKLSLPTALYERIVEAGVSLPGDDVLKVADKI